MRYFAPVAERHHVRRAECRRVRESQVQVVEEGRSPAGWRELGLMCWVKMKSTGVCRRSRASGPPLSTIQYRSAKEVVAEPDGTHRSPATRSASSRRRRRGGCRRRAALSTTAPPGRSTTTVKATRRSHRRRLATLLGSAASSTSSTTSVARSSHGTRTGESSHNRARTAMLSPRKTTSAAAGRRDSPSGASEPGPRPRLVARRSAVTSPRAVPERVLATCRPLVGHQASSLVVEERRAAPSRSGGGLAVRSDFFPSGDSTDGGFIRVEDASDARV